ncbi:methyl-accepting chemotaxis protein [Bradyrhizobium sp. SSBR45G]|uniref:methyl-accepting chemotaxis protein n=1 Tax=unclassified Bradyrhizobium TaxID=2631580 RepID=UPI002342B272|nr:MULTISPECIES: methyl-accepting chemotaxis protein [unclassified Bradyrhizobium]GLH80610.1 methyl-accepting chemotaxis protein [Bradyrhizobium sp. SSBR45G]GLH85816.1 methyl-accepting chemotaxis protein [Bradyrhizobium sp. SSBR45R]
MSKLSIRFKVIAVIVFLLVVMSGLGVLALRSMGGINARTVEITSNWLPSVRALGALRADINMYRLTLRVHVMALTAEAKAAADKRMADMLDKVKQDIRVYQPLIANADERNIYEAWTRAWSNYLVEADKVLDVSRKSVGRLPDDIDGLFKGPAVASAASEELLAKAIDFNDKGAEAATRDAADGYSSTFWIVTTIILVAVAGGLGVGLYLVHDVSSGIASIIKPMQELAKGDLDAEVPHRGEPTEMGAMADTLQVFKEALIAKKEADALAARDAEAKIERGRRVDNITRQFETTIGDIVGTVSSASTQLENSATTLTSTASRAQEISTMVAAASEEASTNVQSVASATEQLSSSITEISRQVQESARMASEAVSQARQTNDRVGELSKAAARIGDVVELINSIAGQTNLLALNATIEAARAGEAGRGFAVVASEVKALAEQTSKATGEIGQQISGIQAATQESVGAIRDISGTIERLSEISSAIAAAVEEQGAATQEISRNVQQSSHATQQVSSSVVDVQRGATATGSASAQVLHAAKSLATDSDRLKREVASFLQSVRVA